MHPLTIIGVLIVLVGLGLFVMNQVRGSKDPDESQVQVWKVNLSGPPALVLILVGVILVAFPFSPWYSDPEDPNPPVTTPTTVAPNTTLLNPDTTMTTATTIVPTVGLPSTPVELVVYNDEACGADTLAWVQDDSANVDGWWISITTYNPDTGEVWTEFGIDTAVDAITFGNAPFLCYYDFTDPDYALDYDLWIYAYNAEGYSEPLYASYADH